jgi:AcrR family transcriptional regulator
MMSRGTFEAMKSSKASKAKPSGRSRREARPQSIPETTAALESRASRRKHETRVRLLEAAFRLMAERGMEAVAINEITEAADVGFGSFYNHFESKEAIYSAVVGTVFESFADALDVLVRDLDDPAEVIAVSVRHTLLRVRREPLWGRFLLREGLSVHAMSHGLGPRLMRDIRKGVDAGRFKTPDPEMAFITVGGGVLGVIGAQLQLASREHPAIGLSDEESASIPERAAAALLHALGLTFAQAEAVARRPLPAGHTKNPFSSTRR